MGIFTRVNNYLARTVGINILGTTPVVNNRLTDDRELLPELLASSDGMETGDRFVRSNQAQVARPSTQKYSKEQIKKSKQAVRERNEINFWNRLWYNVKDIFVDQDIAGQVRRQYKLGASASKEEYINAAHKYMQNKLEGLSESEIIEIYDELKKDFALDITSNDDDAELIRSIYAAILGDFAAGSRTDMAIDLLEVSESDYMKAVTSKELFDNAEYNMTTPDALGNVPEQESATEYFSCVFENMSKEDVEIALNKLSMRADEVEPRIKELLAKTNRTPEEELELQKLQLLHANIIVSGLSGGEIGMMANQYLTNEDLPKLMELIFNTANKHGIQEEVNATVDKYLEAHPEMKEKIEELREIKLEEYFEELRTGFLSKTDPRDKTATEDETTGNKRNITGEDENTEYKQKSHRNTSVLNNKDQNSTSATKGNNNGSYSVGSYTQNAPVSNPQGNLSGENNTASGSQSITENPTPSVSSNPTYIRTTQECKEFLRNNTNGVREFLTGKVHGDSNVENMFIQEYKLKGKEQGEILAVALNKYYNKLECITKISAVRSFFASGGKGNTVDRTRAMQEMIKEDEEKRRNTNFAPRMENMNLV